MFFIHFNQSWGIQTNIFETNIINLAFLFFVFSNQWVVDPKSRYAPFQGHKKTRNLKFLDKYNDEFYPYKNRD